MGQAMPSAVPGGAKVPGDTVPDGPAQGNADRKKQSGRLFLVVFTGLLPYMRRHTGWLFAGLGGALAVTCMRLALPWPLRVIAERWMPGAGGLAAGNEALGGLGLSETLLILSALFLAVVVLLGVFDLGMRYCYSRFALGTVNDLRARAYDAAIGIARTKKKVNSGDLIARVVGDSARVKAGLQGFLVHATTSGMLLFGVILFLLNLHVKLALVFSLAVVGTLLVIGFGALTLFGRATRNRKKEGKLADRIHADITSASSHRAFTRINKKSGRQELSQVALQGITVAIAHVMYGVAVVAALWVGVEAVESGNIQPGDMVLFMMYMLMLRGPLVRLARQGTRTGKILGAARRMLQLVHRHEKRLAKAAANPPVSPL